VVKEAAMERSAESGFRAKATQQTVNRVRRVRSNWHDQQTWQAFALAAAAKLAGECGSQDSQGNYTHDVKSFAADVVKHADALLEATRKRWPAKG